MVVLAAAVAVVADPAVPTTATAGTTPVVHSLSPAPGEVVAAGETELRARLWSETSIASVRVTVDGTEVQPAEVGPHDAAWGAQLSVAVSLEPGYRVVRVEFEDTAGNRAERAWSFTATERTSARLGGATRIETAVEVSRATFPTAGGRTAAVLARADDFADALAGVSLAVTVEGPLLLSHLDALPPATADELRRLLDPDATVYLLGGHAALGDQIARAVEDLGFRTTRYAGVDRYATAAEIARALPPSTGAFLASGASFADALAASAPAARDGLPVLLAPRDRVPRATADALVEREVAHVTIVGGPAALGGDVEEEVAALVESVERVAGPDRYATAAAVLDAFYDSPAAVSLASGVAFPDALAGTRHAAAAGQPLLLTDPLALPPATSAAIRFHQPAHVDVYGGPVAVADHVVGAVLRAAVAGPHAPAVPSTSPALFDTVPLLAAVAVTLDEAIEPAAASVYVEVGGIEVPGWVEETGATTTLTFRFRDGEPGRALDVAHAGRVVLAANGNGGGAVHEEVAFTYLVPDPLFATTGGLELYLPSRYVEMIGFHEASHDGAQQQLARDTATPMMTLPSRNRGTGARTSADIVAAPDVEVLAPVTGRVIRAGSYVLYCRYTDHYLVIEPDDRPGWEVKLLHFRGLRVAKGDRVVAFETVVGDGPRTLPFASQVDRYSDPRNWPHLHLEVVDPSIPSGGGGGC